MKIGVQEQPNSNCEKKLGGCTGRGFRPGQSGNPGGKKRGCVSLTAQLRRVLCREDAIEIVCKLIALAKGGDLHAVKILFERLDSAEIEQRLTRLEASVQQQRN